MRLIDPILLRIAEVRRAFDASFAAPEASYDEDEHRNVLAVRAGDGSFAVRLEALAGVEACRKIVHLPGALPGMLGVAGIRGRLLAVYHLGALLGQASFARGSSGGSPGLGEPALGEPAAVESAGSGSTAGEPSLNGFIAGGPFADDPLGAPRSEGRRSARSRSRWLLVSQHEAGIAFLIEEIEAFLRVALAEFMPAPPGTAGEHVREVLRQGALFRGVIDVAIIADAVARRAAEVREGRRASS